MSSSPNSLTIVDNRFRLKGSIGRPAFGSTAIVQTFIISDKVTVVALSAVLQSLMSFQVPFSSKLLAAHITGKFPYAEMLDAPAPVLFDVFFSPATPENLATAASDQTIGADYVI